MVLFEPKTIDTPNGTIQTPTLFPVRNFGKRIPGNTPKYQQKIPDLNTTMVNTLSIKQKNRTPDLSQGIHNILDFDGIIFADSGGFELKNTEQPPDPKDIIDTQQKMGADIYATLDLPILPDMKRKERQKRIKKNIEYAIKTSEYKDSDALLYASIHGYKPNIVSNTITYLDKHEEFDGFALGGLVPVRPDYSKLFDIVLAARRATEKPLHVFGLAGPLYQPLLMYLGVDTFDSSGFVRSGSNRNYYVPGFGTYEMNTFEQLQYTPCICPVCSNKPLSEIRESRELISLHNLWILIKQYRIFKWLKETQNDIEDYIEFWAKGNKYTQKGFEIAKQKIRNLPIQ